MDLASVVVAVASPPGRAPLAVIRASGPGALAVLAVVGRLERWPGAAPPTGSERGASGDVDPDLDPARASRGTYRVRLDLPAGGSEPARASGGSVAAIATVPLAGVALIFRAPSSFTGEDAFELLLPGNPHLLERVLDALVAAGEQAGVPVRRAAAGEFSFRAWTDGRIALGEAERLAAMIAARSEAGLRAAEALAEEPVAAAARGAAAETADLLALVEAGIDFTDEEDVVAIDAGDLIRRLAGVRERLDEERSRTADAADAEALPWVVLTGAPNAGKSTLFNALLGRPHAIVSDVAGTTRDVLAEPWRPTPVEPESTRLGRGNLPVECLLVDRPGEDEHAARSTPEAEGRRLAGRADARAALLLRCVPVTEPDPPPVEGDRGGPPVLLVRTQADRDPARARGGPDDVVCSAVRGTGLDELRRRIAHQLAERRDDPADHRAFVRPRHRAGLAAASDALAAAIHAARGRPTPRPGDADGSSLPPVDEVPRRLPGSGAGHAASAGAPPPAPRSPVPSPEVVAHHLRTALDELALLAGAIDADEVLGRIFSTFCIGK